MCGWVYGGEPLEIASGHSASVDERFLNGTDVEVVPF